MTLEMYRYRKLSEAERQKIVAFRRESGRPWHSPPHLESEIGKQYLLSAACFNHQHIIGTTLVRLTEFENELLKACRIRSSTVHSWCVLPNHYHVLIQTDHLKAILKEVGKLHGSTSYRWNGEDDLRGRQVWFRSFDRKIRNERHFWATVNYIHHNPVKHGYVDKWTDWLWSSAQEFLNTVGREKAIRIWLDYPVRDYGKDWDE